MKKKNVFTTGFHEIHQGYISRIKKMHNVLVERNFEQLLGMVRFGEVGKVCILMDIWNVSGRDCNSARGQYGAELIHEIDPVIPVLVWDGREYDCPEKDIPSAFKVFGNKLPIKFPNELYLMPGDYNLDQMEITLRFFEGKLNMSDLPKQECLSFSF
jgi:hypothetical protein